MNKILLIPQKSSSSHQNSLPFPPSNHPLHNSNNSNNNKGNNGKTTTATMTCSTKNCDMATTATTTRVTATTTTTTTATTTWSTKNCLSFPFYFVSVSPSQWIHSTRVSIFICHKSPSVCFVPPPPFATPRLSRVARIKLGHNQFIKKAKQQKMKKSPNKQRKL